ncbi:MAG TPA: homoserine O-acetyltransferase [Symbiobacteriaceae bacterium]|nr:homoserine O-acetyltransferase [Symbiobacteriaceae bacterium]
MAREANLSVLVQKHLFHTAKLDLDVAQSIPATVGYETYGQLSPARDNAILICHPFGGTSHAAGRYGADDPATGWWDHLIGSGKAFDTDKYFVIAVDSLCNLSVKSPLVITTGPATINPATGRPYGSDFPQISMRDNVRLQYQLLQSLGIDRLVCVAGPSTGGFQALEWAVTYPDMVDRVVAVAATHQSPAIFALAVCQAGIDAVTADPAFKGGHYYDSEGPTAGLQRAAFLVSTLMHSDAWAWNMWERKTAPGSMHPRADREGRFAFQAGMAELAEALAQDWDANHFVYTARAALLHDIGYANRGLEVAAQKIKARLLLVAISGDMLFPPEASKPLAEAVNRYGGNAEVALMESGAGHSGSLQDCAWLAEPITRFLRREQMH